MRALLGTLAVYALLMHLGVPSALAHGEGVPQTKPQQKCINGLVKNLGKVAKSKGREICKCLKAGSKGKLPGGTLPIEACVNSDGEKTQSAYARTLAKETADCAVGPPDRPDFGITTGNNVNAVGNLRVTGLVRSILGADLDAAIVVESDPNVPNAKNIAKCQVSLVKEAKKCFDTKLKEFSKCLKGGLKAKAPLDPTDSAEHVERFCLMQDPNDPTTPQPDEKGKIAKACVAKIESRVQKCIDKGVDLQVAVPLFDPNVGVPLAAFLDRRAECEFCRSVNAASGLERDCDLFDDGLANLTCLEIAPGCADPNSPTDFDSTFDGIQSVIFDSEVYLCSFCHATVGGIAPHLDLDDPNTSHAELVNVVSVGSIEIPKLMRVLPGDQDLSFLYKKLAAKTLGPPLPLGEGAAMPSIAPALAPEHLEAIRLWIRNGASRTATVEGTAALLGACLPEAQPVTIPVPDPPDPNAGVQFQQTPWPLYSEDENEVCMPTYYDLTLTSVVPASAQVNCADVGASYFNTVNNPLGKCFLYHKQTLHQDPQSHHSIINIYLGGGGVDHVAWGSYTLKFQDPNNPLEGVACDPDDPNSIDPSTGAVPNCSGTIVTSVGCVGYGPGGTAFQDMAQFSGSQQPLLETEFADGVYSILPMQGIIIWNSHAFNLTAFDSTMSQYLNMEFADPNDQLYPAIGIFNTSQIFIPAVAPFTQDEYCWTHTIPLGDDGANMFSIGSHTHQWGVRFRIYEPPNTPCTAAGGDTVKTCPTGSPSQLIYESFTYSDPVALDPGLVISGNVADRTFRYCSLYDNGSPACSTPRCPDVKLRSTALTPPAQPAPGGPCSNFAVQCLSGPNQGQDCNGDHSFCGAVEDALCDACPVFGGVTTTDEMFIMLGIYYVP